jgi:hypothetical protein
MKLMCRRSLEEGGMIFGNIEIKSKCYQGCWVKSQWGVHSVSIASLAIGK